MNRKAQTEYPLVSLARIALSVAVAVVLIVVIVGLYGWFTQNTIKQDYIARNVLDEFVAVAQVEKSGSWSTYTIIDLPANYMIAGFSEASKDLSFRGEYAQQDSIQGIKRPLSCVGSCACVFRYETHNQPEALRCETIPVQRIRGQEWYTKETGTKFFDQSQNKLPDLLMRPETFSDGFIILPAYSGLTSSRLPTGEYASSEKLCKLYEIRKENDILVVTYVGCDKDISSDGYAVGIAKEPERCNPETHCCDTVIDCRGAPKGSYYWRQTGEEGSFQGYCSYCTSDCVKSTKREHQGLPNDMGLCLGLNNP